MHFRLQTTEPKIPWGESIRFALRSIAAEKLNASLTTLAVVIGSAAIVLVVAFGSTSRLYIVSLIEGIGANLAYATLSRGTSTALEDELTPGDLAAVRQAISAVRAVAGAYDVSVDLRIGGQALVSRLVGVTGDFEKIRNLRMYCHRRWGTTNLPSSVVPGCTREIPSTHSVVHSRRYGFCPDCLRRSATLFDQDDRALNRRTARKDLQFCFRHGEFSEAAMQTDHKLRENPNDGLVLTFESGEMDSNLAVENALLFGMASFAGHSETLAVTN